MSLDDSAHAGNYVGKGAPDPKLDGLEAPDLSPEVLANETEEERWARMDSDAHMSVYLVHEGASNRCMLIGLGFHTDKGWPANGQPAYLYQYPCQFQVRACTPPPQLPTPHCEHAADDPVTFPYQTP